MAQARPNDVGGTAPVKKQTAAVKPQTQKIAEKVAETRKQQTVSPSPLIEYKVKTSAPIDMSPEKYYEEKRKRNGQYTVDAYVMDSMLQSQGRKKLQQEFESWQQDVAQFTSSFTEESRKRRNTYQPPEAFGEYASGARKRISALRDQGKYYKAYFDRYGEMYNTLFNSPDLSNGIKSDIDQIDQSLSSAGNYLDEEKKHWASYSDEREWRVKNGFDTPETVANDLLQMDKEIAGLEDALISWETAQKLGDPNRLPEIRKIQEAQEKLPDLKKERDRLTRYKNYVDDYYKSQNAYDRINSKWIEAVKKDPEFSALSKYQSTKNGKEVSYMPFLGDTTGATVIPRMDRSGYDDLEYEYVNGVDPEAVNAFTAKESSKGFAYAVDDKAYLQQLTDDEKATYNYLKKVDERDGTNKREEFLNDIKSTLTARSAAKEKETWEKLSREQPFSTSLFSVLSSPFKMISAVGQVGDYLDDGEIDVNAGYNKFTRSGTAIRGEVGKMAEENFGPVGSFAYNVGMSIADSLLTRGFDTVVPGMGLFVMGTGAGADSVISSKERGLSDDQAIWLGAIAGAVEIATEKVSLGKFLDIKDGDGILKAIGKSTLSEGNEEAVADVCNWFADVLVSKERSEWLTDIDNYMAQGKTESEAMGLAVKDRALELGMDWTAGALSGGISSGVRGGIVKAGSAGQQSSVESAFGHTLRSGGDEAMDAFINAGLQSGKDTQAYQLAKTLQEQRQSQTVSDREIGKTYLAVAQELNRGDTAGTSETESGLAANDAAEEAELWGRVQTADNSLPEDMELKLSPMEAAARAGRQQQMQRIQQQGTERQVTAEPQSRLEESAARYQVPEEKVNRVKRVASLFGSEVEFYSSNTIGENGYRSADGVIHINANSENPVAQIFGHELTHSLEGTKSYDRLRQLVFDRIEDTDGNLDQRRREKQILYAEHGHALEVEGADREIVAEYMEKNLLTDEASIRSLVQNDWSLGQQIRDWIDKVLTKIGRYSTRAAARERVFLTRASRLYSAALKQAQKGGTAESGGETLTQITRQADAAPDGGLDYLTRQLESGEITEEEFDRLYDSYFNGGEEGQWSISERDPEKQRALDTALSMLDNGSTPGEVYDATHLVVMANGDIRDGDTLQKIGERKNGREEEERQADTLGGIQEGVQRRVSGQAGEGLSGSMGGSAERSRSGWEALPSVQRGEITSAVERYMQSLNEEQTRFRGLFKSSEELTEWFYSKYQQGRAVAEEVAALIPDIQGLMDEIDGILDSGKQYSLNDLPNDGRNSESGQSLIEYINENVPKADLPMAQTVEQSANETQSREKTPTRDMLPVKAQQYLRRAERSLLNKTADALGVPYHAGREYLSGIVREIGDEYLESGKVSQETVDRLFDTAYKNGVRVDEDFFEENKELKKHLREMKVTLSEADKSNISDFEQLRKSMFGILRITNEGGVPVDSAYQELNEMAPGLFPEDITHPADQFRRMCDVGKNIRRAEKTLDDYYGEDAETHKAFARENFNNAVNETIGDLRNVKRYAEDRAKVEDAPAPTTMEEVREAYGNLKEARKAYEKVAAKNLLTHHDEVQVGNLLKGTMELDDLNPETDNVAGIKAVYEAKKDYERFSKAIRQWNSARKAELRQQADQYLETANRWKDKRAGILYSRETMERNVLDIVNDKSLAQSIIREYFKPVHDAQAESTRLKNEMRKRVRKLNLSTKETKGMKQKGIVSEAHAVQLLGEAMDNIKVLGDSKGRLEMRDGKTLQDWNGVVQNLWADNPQLDKAKIEGAVEEFRKIYDELFEMMNQSRIRNGYEPVNYRRGYFPHFQPGSEGGLIGLFGKAMGIETEVTALPTAINGLTHTFRPGIQWFGNTQQRLGYNTAYDAVEGFDRYIEGVADVIYQTDNIQKLRALASQIRYRTSDDGIRKQVDEVKAMENLSEEDKQNRINKIYESGKYTLSNFVVELEEYTNLLANKKSRADRNMEQTLGRNMYNKMKALESRVAANMVAVNPASWLTNFIPLTQGGALLGQKQLLKGMWQTLRAYVKDDGFVNASTFLTNRRGSDPLVKTWSEKFSGTLSSPMEYIDRFTSDTLVRARYSQNLKQGLSEAEAMSEADSWAAGVMADRSKGSMPTIFNRSNPLTKLFTQFQLEVNNQWSYLFKDLPRESKEKKRALLALTNALLKFFLGAWLYNEVYEFFIGRRPALEPLGMLNDLAGDLTGYQFENLVELGAGYASGENPDLLKEVGKESTYNTVVNAGANVAEELPFVGGLLGGGRLPINSALPDPSNLLKAATGENWSTKKRLATAGKELGKPLTYLVPPFGGGQLKKIYEGLNTMLRGGSYTVDAEGNDILQYPVISDTPMQALQNYSRSLLFGKTSLESGQEWIANDFKNLSAKQTAVYQAMLDAEVPARKAIDLIRELHGIEKTEAESKAQQEVEILKSAEISGTGKNVVYYGLIASDKERELMDRLDESGADAGAVVETLLQMKSLEDQDGADRSYTKRAALMESDLSNEQKKEIYRYMFGTRQEDGNYASSREEDIAAFEDAGMDIDTFLDVQNMHALINDEDESANEKATDFSYWINGKGFSDKETAVIKSCFRYYSMTPAVDIRYDKFTEAGLSSGKAYELEDELDDLSGDAKQIDRFMTVAEMPFSEAEKAQALSTMMQSGTYNKYQTVAKAGISTYVYIKFLYDTKDYSGKGKKDKICAYINAMKITAPQKDALFCTMYKESGLGKTPWH